MPHRAFIGLGTNLGDRAANYREAVQRIAALPTTRVVRQSSIYETEPVGDIKGAFINGVVEVETELAPDAMMRRLARDRAGDGTQAGARQEARVEPRQVPPAHHRP